MEHQQSFEALDDLDVDALLRAGEHKRIFAELVKAMKSKTTRGARAEAAMGVNDNYTDAEAEAAYAWGDAHFKAAMEAFPRRLPIEEHRKLLLEIRIKWVRPLRFLGGIARFIERQGSKKAEDAHWHRWKLVSNRAIKAKSPARRAWLEGNKDRQRLANQKANIKRKAKRAEARVAKKAAKAAAQ